MKYYKITISRIIYVILISIWLQLVNDNVMGEIFTLGYLTGSQRKPGDMEYIRPGLTISGAITIAKNEVNSNKLKIYNHSIEIIVAETYGDEEISIKQTALLWTQGVAGYIGPQETCIHEGRMAAAFNLPMISYFCTHHETSNKKYFPTFGRTRPPDTQISKSVVSLLLYFNWTQVSFFYLNDSEFIPVAETIQTTLKLNGLQLRSVMSWDSIYHHGYMRNPFDLMVEQTYLNTRIYLILGHHYEHIGLIVSLQQRGLLDNGEYFVVGVDLEQYDLATPEKYLRGVLQNDPDPDSVEGFQSYLGIIPSAPVKFDEFAGEVNKYLEMAPFEYINPLNHIGGAKQIRAEAAYLYDAVHLYADSMIKVLDSGGNPRNGSQILNALKGSNYQSAMGYLVHVDENGDAAGNYTVLARKFLNTSVGFGLVPVGIFTVPRDDELPEMHVEKIKFVGGLCPVAEPKCGFRGEKCINYTGEISMGVGGGALVVLGFVALVLYRNWKYEQELDSLLWKIDFRDIKMHDVDKENTGHKVTRSNHPLIRTSQVSLSSNPDADFRYSTIYTPIGLYKGQLYSIKKMKKKNIDITREMKKELKILKDIRYDNLISFIGACIDPPNVCIITEYCNKGSLKDVLENESVKLDNMFIASLVGDIIRAMIYLHESPIKYHGNLCTSNCLIDSRWVVKLSDFGLFAFKQGVEEKIETPADLLKCENKLLYRAPELLRAASDVCIPGSQKGDVYSFAIILYETHTRHGPFGEIDCSAMECLERILYPRDPNNPFRPAIQALESCFDCVRECIRDSWSELPEDRPDFKTIRTRLRPLRKGMKPNIFDNMMAMMEKYANNLEQLVDERTDQLQEEKKKTEALLLEMLPRPVAEQLKKGLKVEAESYDMVTIYFSDIVGFTAMSANSTPLQVVDFLNDLYTCFDSIIGNYDVYKVETIGDAYMVVSGLPIRNQIHAAEIASMSLDLLEAITEFQIRHRPDEKLLLRIGIHSGPVCAGVVGLKMPRYCLFGDTVNTASRMESTGMQLKIHCSDDCRALLEKLGGFLFEDRGLIPMKGKGDKKTFWLLGEDPDIRARRTRERKERRGSKALNKFIQKNNLPFMNNGDLLGIRSSLKQNNNGYGPLFKSLPRSSSLESPKKLRFASTTFLEYNRYHHGCSDDALLEVISNASPRKSDGSIQIGEDTTSSCPCIENCGSTIDEKLNQPPKASSTVNTPLLSKHFQVGGDDD